MESRSRYQNEIWMFVYTADACDGFRDGNAKLDTAPDLTRTWLESVSAALRYRKHKRVCLSRSLHILPAILFSMSNTIPMSLPSTNLCRILSSSYRSQRFGYNIWTPSRYLYLFALMNLLTHNVIWSRCDYDVVILIDRFCIIVCYSWYFIAPATFGLFPWNSDLYVPCICMFKISSSFIPARNYFVLCLWLLVESPLVPSTRSTWLVSIHSVSAEWNCWFKTKNHLFESTD